MLSIKNADIKDILLIRELCFKVWPQTYKGIISEEQINYMLDLMYSEESLQKQMIEQQCQFIFVYDDEEPVGFASFGKTAPGVFKLHKIYILPGQQGKGTGKFVIDHIIKEVKNKGGNVLQLQVNIRNQAKKFYEKLGFTTLYQFDFPIGNGYVMDDYLMEKKLS
jgi:ribosomal protein S18 acetylase RimI-like enzyme